MKDKLGKKKPIVSVIGIMLAVMMCFGISLSSSQTVYAADGGMVIEEKKDDTIKESDSKKDEKTEIRYPNKLTPNLFPQIVRLELQRMEMNRKITIKVLLHHHQKLEEQ